MKIRILSLMLLGLALQAMPSVAQERLPEYLQAEKFTREKLNTMLFSTKVDPHWFPTGNDFWFEYKTSEGTSWYVVDPDARRKTPLFDRDELASQLTEIVHDPFEARHLPIQNLKVKEDGRTFTFEVTSSQDKKPKKDDKKKADTPEKEVFYFSYDYPTRKLTLLTEEAKEPKRLDWASVSPDGQTVVYAKDCNLYRMSIADYRKAPVQRQAPGRMGILVARLETFRDRSDRRAQGERPMGHQLYGFAPSHAGDLPLSDAGRDGCSRRPPVHLRHDHEQPERNPYGSMEEPDFGN